MRARMLSIIVVLALAAPAAGQSASVSLTLENAPSAQEITAGESADLSSDANLTVDGVSCASSVDVPVNVTASVTPQGSLPSNASNSVGQSALTFTVPQGAHDSGAPVGEGAYNEAQAASLAMQTGSGVTQNYTVSVSLVASTPGVSTQNCVPQEIPAAESDPVAVTVDVIADDPPEPDTGSDDGTDDGTDDGGDSDFQSPPSDGGGAGNETGDDGGNGIPAPTALVPIAALGAALLARRRRA